MAQDGTLYDLVLLLSRSATDDARQTLVSEVESAITSGGGSVERNQAWGMRPLTYQIRHEAEADYHLIQFTGPTSLLESLSHSLRISDTVLRFRIIKVIPGTPAAPESAPPLVGAIATGGGHGGAGSSSAGASSAPSSGGPADAGGPDGDSEGAPTPAEAGAGAEAAAGAGTAAGASAGGGDEREA